MTLLTHARGPGPAFRFLEERSSPAAGTAAAHWAAIRRFGAGVLAILAAGAAFAAVMALKVAIYLPHFIHP
jgi:hypothetical protein